MKKGEISIEPVKGGSILRDAATGRFHAVEKATGETTRLSASSRSSVLAVSGKRSASLRRLADR